MSVAGAVKRLFEPRAPMRPGRTAIIDIGSNSIRLVVYEGAERIPSPLFNEKVMAGLGRSLARTGAIDADAMAAAKGALARFAWLAREMEVARLRTVATAAAREASNGAELIAAAEACGLTVELLSGEEEATMAGLGVLSAIPDADGIVADLGGGSLELVRVVAGTVTDRASFPLGVLRIAAIRAKGQGALDRRVEKLLGEAGWSGRGERLPLYMVGGSWRALSRLDMHLTGYPLPVVHGYLLSRRAMGRIRREVASIDRSTLRAELDISAARLPTLEDAASLLLSVTRHLGSKAAIASAFGLREGLLFAGMSHEARMLDPLIEAARDEGRRLGRFGEHGDLIERWIAPLFADEDTGVARLRHAACLLTDVGWSANPEFRADRGIEIALHGNWVAVDGPGRALMAQALYTALCGATDSPAPLGQLASPAALARAARWGLAMRLAQRLSGGVAAPLERTTLRLTTKRVELVIPEPDRMLYGETVERRHRALAGAMGREAALA